MSDQLSQSNPVSNRSMPPGTVIPELVYPDLPAAVAWLCATFGFRERLRIGSHRSQILVGADAAIVAVQAEQTDAAAQSLHGQPTHSLMVHVDDVDRHYAQVAQSGARIISSPADYPFGERQYTVEDLVGRRWTFSQSIADVDPRSWGGVLGEGADGMA